MGVQIFNNIASVNARRLLDENSARLTQSIQRMSSGIRINKASDDAAGLAISEGLRSDIRTLRQALRNANDGMSLIQITEGALQEQGNILIRLRELASQSANGTVGSTERASIQLEFSALRDEVDRISSTTEFNGQGLVDGSLASSVAVTSHVLIQIGLSNHSNSRMNLNTAVNLTEMTSTGLEIHNLSLTSADDALVALNQLDTAINTMTASRGKIGSVQNRLSTSVSSLSLAIENYTAAESQIRDADMAFEIAELTKNQILVQASTAMVSQANMIPQGVLSLLS
jgi:flagellin